MILENKYVAWERKMKVAFGTEEWVMQTPDPLVLIRTGSF
jgi:hypothetical protein